MQDINIILFDNFTLLDAFGPIEVFRCLEKYYSIKLYSLNGGKVKSVADLEIETKPIIDIKNYDILLIPGGAGVREIINDNLFINEIKKLTDKSSQVLSVCTGSALLAKTGLLNGKKATSNKMAFDWVVSQNNSVNWVKKARWINDGKYYTSSGITAGIDMTLGFVRDKISLEVARRISIALEYKWNENSEDDLFA